LENALNISRAFTWRGPDEFIELTLLDAALFWGPPGPLKPSLEAALTPI
jgi:hypothetical protein